MTMMTWCGSVGNAKINGRFIMINKRGRGGLAKSPAYRSAIRDMTTAFQSQWSASPLVGPVTVEMTVWWPKRHRVGPADGQALGDVDACCKAVLDALEAAGVVTDDAQVERMTATKGHDPRNPRIEVKVEPWDG